LNWTRHPDAASFLATAGPMLEADLLLNQTPLGVARQIVAEPSRWPDPRLYTVHGDDGAVLGTVLQTPPWLPHVSDMPLPALVFAAGRFADAHRDAGGVFGSEEAAIAFAAVLLTRRDGVSSVDVERMGLFELTAVAEVPRPPGRFRRARPSDAPLLQRWIEAFTAEAVPHEPPPGPTAGERAIARGGVRFWEVEGDSVAYANFGRDLGTHVSIGPVFTPPERRGRGFATGLVAEMSAAALAEGRVGCTLFTDLANPTSNRIYERIGYVRVGTMRRIGFVTDEHAI
jgi:RimJ/RimL family protein N-acetyltransferase